MPQLKVDDAIRDIRDGKMVILVDDESRENEGDLCMAAEKVTPQAINFMTKYGRGLICLAMTAEKLSLKSKGWNRKDISLTPRTDRLKSCSKNLPNSSNPCLN